MVRKSFLIPIVFLVVSLSACIPKSTPTPTPVPSCDPASLVPPDLISPDWREVVDGTSVVLDWSYLGSCIPTQFEIILAKDREFSTISLTETVSGTTTSWSSPALDSAEEYFWRVRAVDGGSTGSWSEELRSFFTEPLCELSDLVAPIPQYPPFGGIFTRGYDSLEWEWPVSSCIPPGYVIELALDGDFTDTSLNGATGTPGTRWGPGVPLAEASMYEWRVAAIVGTEVGPFSRESRFFTDPICAGGSLIAPELLSPADRETITITTTEFNWDYLHLCSPQGFHFQVSANADMSSPIIDVESPTVYSSRFIIDPLLEDCRSYFWRVAVISDGITGPFSEIQEIFMDTTGSCSCDPGDIPVPVKVWPEPWEIVPDLLPHMRWFNPGDCFPDGYAISLDDDYFFSDASLNGGTPSYDRTSWGPRGPLFPATEYWWKVAGVVGSTVGEYSGPRPFLTGPECASLAEVTAPVLLDPPDGAVLDTLEPTLHWTTGDPPCLPTGHIVNVQEDPTFRGTEYGMDFHDFLSMTGTTDTLDDCTRYYWKVTPLHGMMAGPESEVRTFFTNVSGTCTIPGTAKMNTFCREGTFPEHWPEPDHLFMQGDPVQVIAQNPFSTYLLVYVPGENGEPVVPYVRCWTLFSAVDPLEGYSFSNLPIEYPPPTPIPTPTPKITCHQNLGPNACVAAGGIYHQQNQVCQCP